MRPNGKRLTISGSGDILIHNSLSDQAKNDGSAERYDFAPMLSGAKARVSSADFAICHFRDAVLDPAVVTEFPPLRQAGAGSRREGDRFDECDTASRWSLDKGPDGISARSTRSMPQVSATPEQRVQRQPPPRPKSPTLREFPSPILAYAWDFNGERPPADRPWEANLIDPDR